MPGGRDRRCQHSKAFGKGRRRFRNPKAAGGKSAKAAGGEKSGAFEKLGRARKSGTGKATGGAVEEKRNFLRFFVGRSVSKTVEGNFRSTAGTVQDREAAGAGKKDGSHRRCARLFLLWKRNGGIFRQGIGIVSGMARRADGIAQRAALSAGGYSVAVLGCGVDICYPEENRPLYERLWENGCILSEYPPGTLPHSRLFPPRNRIISALSDLVLVIEAREKSGTLITVDMALEQGKDVFAVPGRITDTCSRGCNRLIGNGAGIAVSVAQLLQELQGSVPHAGRDEAFSLAQAERPNAAKAAGVIADKMLCPVTDALSSTASSSWPPLRKTIWQALDTMPQSMDEIADTLVRQKISINVQMLMQELVFLELEGAAGSVMGRYYRKTFACNDG